MRTWKTAFSFLAFGTASMAVASADAPAHGWAMAPVLMEYSATGVYYVRPAGQGVAMTLGVRVMKTGEVVAFERRGDSSGEKAELIATVSGPKLEKLEALADSI